MKTEFVFLLLLALLLAVSALAGFFGVINVEGFYI